MLAMSMPLSLPQFASCMTGHTSMPGSSCQKCAATSSNSQASPKRPKLSLQTSSLPISYGTSSKGLSLNTNTLGTVTPTTANTFSNTWDLTVRPSPISATASPSTRSSTRPVRSESPNLSRQPDQPYSFSQPFGLKSILKNTPLHSDALRPTVNSSPRESRRKVFFPLAKSVGFRKELEDVIVNNQYVARHSDLLSPFTDSHDEAENLPHNDSPKHMLDDDDESDDLSDSTSSPPLSKRRKGSRRDSGVSVSPPQEMTGALSEASTAAKEDGKGLNIASDSITSTTSYSTNRKSRSWEWTLTPLQVTTSEPASKASSYHLPDAGDGTPGSEHNSSTSQGAGQQEEDSNHKEVDQSSKSSHRVEQQQRDRSKSAVLPNVAHATKELEKDSSEPQVSPSGDR